MVDADAATEEFWHFGVSGPSFVGTVDDDGEYRDGLFATIEDEDHAGGDGADGAVFAAGAFGKDVEEVAFVEDIDGHADGSEVCGAAFDGESVPEFHEVVEESAFEERIAPCSAFGGRERCR